MTLLLYNIAKRLPYSLIRCLVWIYTRIILNRVIVYFLYGEKSCKYDKYQHERPLGPRKSICYAPHSSMFFGVDGAVTICCFNRHILYGNIRNNSIADCWNSISLKKMKENLNNHDLNHGCFYCKYTIENNNYQSVAAQQYDFYNSKDSMPTFLIFELSNKCNLNCIMCNIVDKIDNANIGSDNFEKEPYTETFVNDLKKYIPYLKKAKFLGGEPFFIPVYYRIWQLITELNPKCIIEVQTNASILNKKIINLMNTGNFQVYASIDSFKKQTYELIRKNASFEKIMANLDYLLQYGKKKKYNFSISVCPIKQNMWEIPEMVEFCNNKNCLIYFNIVWAPVNCSLRYLESNEISNLIKHYQAYKTNNNSELIRNNVKQLESLINLLKVWEKDVKTKEIYLEKLKSKNIDIDNLTQSQYISLFKEIIEELCTADKLNYYVNRIKKLAEHIDNEDVFREIYLMLISIHAEQILSELDNKDDKQILDNIMRLISKN